MRPESMAMATPFACTSRRKRSGSCRQTLGDAARSIAHSQPFETGGILHMTHRPDPSPDTVLIAQQAVATLTVPGYVDFLATDGRAIWATNTDRVEKFEVDQASPVETVEMPSPCGGMVVAFGSLWVASCKELSIYRIDLRSNSVSAIVATG